MVNDTNRKDPDRWARLRFAIIGPLLAAPAAAGELKKAIQELAAKFWQHPVSGERVQFGFSSIERWFYAARKAQDPVAALRRKRRSDAGRQFLGEPLIRALRALYQQYSSWSVRLLYDNLAVLVAEDPVLGPLRSYATIRRYMKANGLQRKKKPRKQTAGALQAQQRLESREVRSYETEHSLSLLHLDFHHGSKKVLVPSGQWVTPLLLGVIDDYSRLIVHLQWYLEETAKALVHGVSQAFQRYGLPRAVLSDNGSAMVSDEFKQGLHVLGIVHETTLPYSPYQNGKQETVWTQVEGRLMAMLEKVEDLTLEMLNEMTQVWVEYDYNQDTHEEIGTWPLRRFLDGPTVARNCPDSQTLRRAFRCQVNRRQRRSDGTFSLQGQRFEVPSRYRHLEDLRVSYARWDLTAVDLIDPETLKVLCPLYPLDKAANANGYRRLLDVDPVDLMLPIQPIATHQGLPPLLRKMMADFAATGKPPAYLPMREQKIHSKKNGEDPS